MDNLQWNYKRRNSSGIDYNDKHFWLDPIARGEILGTFGIVDRKKGELTFVLRSDGSLSYAGDFSILDQQDIYKIRDATGLVDKYKSRLLIILDGIEDAQSSDLSDNSDDSIPLEELDMRLL